MPRKPVPTPKQFLNDLITDLQGARPAPDLSQWLTKSQAAEQLRTSISTIERMIQRRELESTHRPQPGRKPETVVSPADIARMRPLVATPAFLTAPQTQELAAIAPTPAAAIAPLLAAFSQAFTQPRIPQRYMTLEEASEATGLSVRYLRGVIKAGQLQAVKDGRKWKVKPSELASL